MKRQLIKIAETTHPDLKRKLADLAMVETLRDCEIDCISLLRRAAFSSVLSPASPEEREAAFAVLDEITPRCDRRIFDLAVQFPDSMKEKMGELATVGHVVARGGRDLLEATALFYALKPASPEERSAALDLLEKIGIVGNARQFITLVRIGQLDVSDIEAFIKLQLELSIRNHR